MRTTNSGRALVSVAANGATPTGHVEAGTSVHPFGTPDPTRTHYERLVALTPTRGTTSPKPKLVPRTPDSLLERGIDVTAHVGHVTSQLDGLVTHLRAGLLSDHEVVDADSGVRRDGQLTARFHRRIIFPVRDPHVRVIGVYGLDVTGGTDSQQYLNTTGFRKGSPAYWLRTP